MDEPSALYLHDYMAGSSFAVELPEKLASELPARFRAKWLASFLNRCRSTARRWNN